MCQVNLRHLKLLPLVKGIDSILSNDNDLIHINYFFMDSITRKIDKFQWETNVGYRDLIKAISINSMLMIIDKNGIFKDVNHKTCSVSGYNREELINQTYGDIFGNYPSHQEHIGDAMSAIEKDEVWMGEVKQFTKAGTAYWTYTIVHPFKDESNHIIGMISISQIITRGKMIAEQLYRQSKDLEELAFINSHIVRNSLSTILGLCNLFKDEIIDYKVEQVKEAAQYINLVALDLDNAIYQMQAKIQQARNEKTHIKNEWLGKRQSIKRIMLIDDDELSHLITKRIIQYVTNNSIEVMKFKSARQAIYYLINEINPLPDIILLDIEMPRMDGWSFLATFEKLHTGIPVGILTNSIRSNDQYKAIKYESVNSFWSKPLKKEHVEKLLAIN